MADPARATAAKGVHPCDAEGVTSTLLQRPALPPVDSWAVINECGGEFWIAKGCRTSTVPSPIASTGRARGRPRRHPVRRCGTGRLRRRHARASEPTPPRLSSHGFTGSLPVSLRGHDMRLTRRHRPRDARQKRLILPGAEPECHYGHVCFPCPCCGYLQFSEPPGSYELCAICFWEDDAVQLRWPDYAGGANKPSLEEAQDAYANNGVSERRHKQYVRRASEGDTRDEGWRPIDRSVDRFEPRGSRIEEWPSDMTSLYWWRPTFWRGSGQAPAS